MRPGSIKLKGSFKPKESLRGDVILSSGEGIGEFVFKRDADFVRFYHAPSKVQRKHTLGDRFGIVLTDRPGRLSASLKETKLENSPWNCFSSSTVEWVLKTTRLPIMIFHSVSMKRMCNFMISWFKANLSKTIIFK